MFGGPTPIICQPRHIHTHTHMYTLSCNCAYVGLLGSFQVGHNLMCRDVLK